MAIQLVVQLPVHWQLSLSSMRCTSTKKRKRSTSMVIATITITAALVAIITTIIIPRTAICLLMRQRSMVMPMVSMRGITSTPKVATGIEALLMPLKETISPTRDTPHQWGIRLCVLTGFSFTNFPFFFNDKNDLWRSYGTRRGDVHVPDVLAFSLLTASLFFTACSIFAYPLWWCHSHRLWYLQWQGHELQYKFDTLVIDEVMNYHFSNTNPYT